RSVIWFFFWPTCVSFLSAYVFYVLRDEAIELPGKVPCGRHFRIWQNQPEHAPGWLGSNKVRTPCACRGCLLGSTGKKKKKASSNKNCVFSTLTQLERDLVNFVSRVWNLKLTAATCCNCRRPNLEVPADAHNNYNI
ncbi:hypothetical protein FD755_016271, partial [Muntiacus reevesi]